MSSHAFGFRAIPSMSLQSWELNLMCCFFFFEIISKHNTLTQLRDCSWFLLSYRVPFLGCPCNTKHRSQQTLGPNVHVATELKSLIQACPGGESLAQCRLIGRLLPAGWGCLVVLVLPTSNFLQKLTKLIKFGKRRTLLQNVIKNHASSISVSKCIGNKMSSTNSSKSTKKT